MLCAAHKQGDFLMDYYLNKGNKILSCVEKERRILIVHALLHSFPLHRFSSNAQITKSFFYPLSHEQANHGQGRPTRELNKRNYISV